MSIADDCKSNSPYSNVSPIHPTLTDPSFILWSSQPYASSTRHSNNSSPGHNASLRKWLCPQPRAYSTTPAVCVLDVSIGTRYTRTAPDEQSYTYVFIVDACAAQQLVLGRRDVKAIAIGTCVHSTISRSYETSDATGWRSRSPMCCAAIYLCRRYAQLPSQRRKERDGAVIGNRCRYEMQLRTPSGAVCQTG